MLICSPPMEAAYKNLMHDTFRLGPPLSLIFFAFFFVSACRYKNQEKIAIVWSGNQATGISVPIQLLKDEDESPVVPELEVRLQNTPAAMLGDYSISDGVVLFRPLIPFSRGLRYQIFYRKKMIGGMTIPVANASEAPSLVAIYPSADTVPENLLKIYLQFSSPMREGEAMRHIALLNSKRDTLEGVFLDLQPELWNKDRTVLTVWLDPGRIKRELAPNLQMGNPLQNGESYSIAVSDHWKDVQGLTLRQPYSRKFFVGPRDSLSPQHREWKMEIPAKQTIQPVKISFPESLDYFLLAETISILDKDGSVIKGKIHIDPEERGFAFLPEKQWHPGRYRMHIAPYLEDIAGNNMERLFDRDIRKAQTSTGKEVFEREFIIPRQ